MKKLIPLILLLFVGNSVAEDILLCVVDQTNAFAYKGHLGWQKGNRTTAQKYIFKGDLESPNPKGRWYKFGGREPADDNCKSLAGFDDILKCELANEAEFTLSKVELFFAGSRLLGYLDMQTRTLTNEDVYLTLGSCSRI